ncbi:MAG TPA: response regulator [Bryobacteraceae bacterium]|nr:response regulator [Bryobacteraceae bacterium]
MPEKTPMVSTILLLISEPVVRLVIREVLERAGYVVLATGDLGVAVERMSESRPDLLMISPYVETISGHEAAKYLHSRNPDMRVLMVAGLLADERLEYRAELENVEIFPKPFTPEELLAEVKDVLRA